MLILILGLATLVFASGFCHIPTNHYGVITVFGKKLKRTLDEGIRYGVPALPWIGKVLLYTYELITQTLKGNDSAVVITKDHVKIVMEGSVQYRPDRDNLLLFTQMTPATICEGLKDAIEEGLSEIAGQEESESFYTKREEISLLINCLFKADRRPDYYLPKDDEGGPGSFTDMSKKVPSFDEYLKKIGSAKELSIPERMENLDKLARGRWVMPPKRLKGGKFDVLSFYKLNVTRIVRMLELQRQMKEKSPIEKTYGIDIETFKLAKTEFTPETMAAMEKKKQAEKELEGQTLMQARKMKIMKELIDAGIPPEKASDDADALLGIGKKTIISGGTGLPIINVNP